MWIVKLALRRPYTFIVLAVLLFIIGPLAIVRTPTDIFPNINVPVVSVVWSFNGLSAEDMARRITSNYERALTSDVDDIEHIESQSLNGVSVVKIFFHPGADINRAVAEASANSESILRVLPPGTLPPNIITYNASTVPVLELGLSSDTLPEQSLYDLGNSFIRTQLATVQGAAVPLPFGGKIRQIMVELDPAALQAKGLAPLDVVNAVNAQNLILPGGTAKIGKREYNVEMNGSTDTVAELNNLPIKTVDGGVIYVRDVAHVIDGYAPQTNIVRSDGKRAALLEVEKTGSASTLTIIQQVKAMLPKIAAGLPSALRITPLSDQSVFVKSAIDGVVREAAIAACLTAAMILLFLGSWRATLIIAVTIPLAVLTSLIALSALGQTINIMTLGGLALAVGILVDDATVAIENITHHLENGAPLHDAILNGSGEIAVPTFVSTLSICIVFVPMFLLSGGRPLPVRAARGSGGIRDVRIVLFLAHADSDARDVPDACARNQPARGQQPFRRADPLPGRVRASLRTPAQRLSRCARTCDCATPPLHSDLPAAMPRLVDADSVRRPRLLPRGRHRRNPPAHARTDGHADRGNRTADRRSRSENPHGHSGRGAGRRARQHRRAR